MMAIKTYHVTEYDNHSDIPKLLGGGYGNIFQMKRMKFPAAGNAIGLPPLDARRGSLYRRFQWYGGLEKSIQTIPRHRKTVTKRA